MSQKNEAKPTRTHRIKLLILVPTAVTLATLLLLFIGGVYWLQTSDLDRWFTSQLACTKTQLHAHLSAETQQLGVASDILRRDQRLWTLWATADRDAILAETLPILENIREKYGISHLYFHGPDRVNLLRVHRPEQHGDLIDRYTARRAAASKRPSHGLELGPLGTFTLRHVRPWIIEGKLLGYVELGSEFNFIADAMNDVWGMRAILLIKKEYLNRKGWENGMEMLGHPADWDLLPEMVVAGNTFGPIPYEVLKKLAALEELHNPRGMELSADEKTFRGGCISLRDVAGRDVADMVVLLDITSQKAALHRLIAVLSVSGLLLALILLGSVYYWLQRLEKRLAKADRNTRQEANLRQSYQEKHLQRIEVINRLQEELIAPMPAEEKCKKITDATVSIFGLDFCRIWWVAPADLCESGCIHAKVTDGPHICRHREQCLHLVASSGRYKHLDGNHRRVPLGAYKIGRIADGSEKSFLTNDVTNDTRVHDHEWARKLRLVSFAGYRLHDERGDAMGVLALFAKHPISAEDDVMLAHLGEVVTQIILASRVEEQLLRASAAAESASQAKSLFIANISHELRTPLHGMLSFATFGKKRAETADRETLGDYFKKISQSGHNLLALVNDLFDLSKLESEEAAILPRSNNINDLIQIIVDEFASYAALRHIRIIYDNQRSAGELVIIDQERIVQVLRNLLSNAVKYSHSGGDVKVSLHRKGNRLTVSVSDGGVGIPEDELEAVFDKFIQSSRTRTGAGGSGLGLAICREIIAAHHGRIWAENQPGGGAKLTFVIPCDPEKPVDWLENLSPNANDCLSTSNG